MNFGNIFILNWVYFVTLLVTQSLCVTDRTLRPSGKRNTKKLSALIYWNGFNFAGYAYQFSAVFTDNFGGPLRKLNECKKYDDSSFKNSNFTTQLFPAGR